MAEKNQLTTGTLTWEDQQNNADYKASASGTNIQGTSIDGKIHGGITPVRTQDIKDHADGTTKAGVAEGAITITDKENQKQDIVTLNRDIKNSLNKLAQIFDKDDVKERQELVNTFNRIAFDKVGDIAQEQGWSLDDNRRAALHALIGGISAALGGGNIISGAAGAGINERLQPIIAKFVKDNPDLKEWVSILVGDAIGKLSGDENAGQAGAWNGTKYNNIAHAMVNPVVLLAGYTVVNLENGTQQIQNAAGEVVGYISTAGEFIADGADDAAWEFSGFIEEYEDILPDSLVLWAKKTRLSGKEKASDSPSWVDNFG